MKKTAFLTTALFLPALFAASCGGGSQTPAPTSTPAASAPAAPSPAAPAAGHGSITGKVMFEGTPPAKEQIKMDADPACQKMHTGPVFKEIARVNDNGTLRDVFVYVKSGLEGQSFPPPSEPVVFDQRGCHYTPHVFGIMAKQPLRILNSDDTLHNIHALPANSTQFNIAMPKFLKEKTVNFENPEVMVRIKCEVHPWMGAWAGVLSHPFFGVSDDQGGFALKGLPAGSYTVEAWHEKYGTATQQESLGADETKEISFTFKAN